MIDDLIDMIRNDEIRRSTEREVWQIKNEQKKKAPHRKERKKRNKMQKKSRRKNR